MCTEQGRRGRWVWHSCCLEAEVEMQLQRNSWRLWPTASQDAVSCLDAIIKQRQPLFSDTDSTTTQLRTHTHTRAHSRTHAQVTWRLSKLVGMGKLFICCAFMPLIFSFCCALWFFVTLPQFCSSYFGSFLNIFLPLHRLSLFLSNCLYFLRISEFVPILFLSNYLNFLRISEFFPILHSLFLFFSFFFFFFAKSKSYYRKGSRVAYKINTIVRFCSQFFVSLSLSLILFFFNYG